MGSASAPQTCRIKAVFFSTASTQTTKGDALDLLDARLRLTHQLEGNRSLEFAGWVKNITNESSRVAGVDFGASFAHATVSYYNPPRTFGGDVIFRF